MTKDKCKYCKHYDSFFDSCKLYVKDVYLGEGEWDIQPVRIKNIEESECGFEEVK